MSEGKKNVRGKKKNEIDWKINPENANELIYEYKDKKNKNKRIKYVIDEKNKNYKYFIMNNNEYIQIFEKRYENKDDEIINKYTKEKIDKEYEFYFYNIIVPKYIITPFLTEWEEDKNLKRLYTFILDIKKLCEQHENIYEIYERNIVEKIFLLFNVEMLNEFFSTYYIDSIFEKVISLLCSNNVLYSLSRSLSFYDFRFLNNLKSDLNTEYMKIFIFEKLKNYINNKNIDIKDSYFSTKEIFFLSIYLNNVSEYIEYIKNENDEEKNKKCDIVLKKIIEIKNMPLYKNNYKIYI